MAVLALAVLGLHGLLLAGWPSGWSAPSTPAPRALSVRQIVLPAAAPTVAPPPAAEPAPAPVITKPVPPITAGPVPPITSEFAAEPSATESTPPVEPAPRLVAVAAAAPLVAADPPPIYRTRLPPSTVLQYELRRGAVTGEGELRWQRHEDGYEMSIEGSVFGFQVLSQISRGGFDLAGLAPLRFVDRRRGRDVRAANFQRDRGLITYSGSPAEYPLLAGAQDRLSWMVQLAAIVEAEPARWRAGEHVEMLVSGSRGDADVWTFTVTGREAVDLVGIRLERALALRREPRKPYDTRVEVWLDPERHHLPARIRLSSERGAEALEFVLKP